MEDYVSINGKKLRKGYTTGSCAAAASKAAVLMLMSGEPVYTVRIDTPAGVKLDLQVCDGVFTASGAKCAIVKDGGDDPDVTSGLKVFAEVAFSTQRDIRVMAGQGIGIVTLPGLKVEVGKPAINPVPMRMILKEVKEVLEPDKGVDIVLSVPGGEIVSERTYNPKLGIMGGISILGTTGIVSPMSEDAWKTSLELELGIMAARGIKIPIFTFGNYGEAFASRTLGIHGGSMIKISNFVGFMLEKAVENRFEKLLLIGHLGKLVKVAAGIFNTHSKVADARMEILAAYAALEGASREAVESIFRCTTTSAAAEVIHENAITGVYDRIVANVSRRCREHVFGKLTVGAVLFNEDNTLLSMDANAESILNTAGRKQSDG